MGSVRPRYELGNHDGVRGATIRARQSSQENEREVKPRRGVHLEPTSQDAGGISPRASLYLNYHV